MGGLIKYFIVLKCTKYMQIINIINFAVQRESISLPISNDTQIYAVQG